MKIKNLFISGLTAISLMLIPQVSSDAAAAELSQQEREMRKMLIEMLRTSMLQSCDGLQVRACVQMDEQSCRNMMNDVVNKCVQSTIDETAYTIDGQCSSNVLAEYGITEAAAERCRLSE